MGNASHGVFLGFLICLTVGLYGPNVVAEDIASDKKVAFLSSQKGNIFPYETGSLELAIGSSKEMVSCKIIERDEELRMLQEITIPTATSSVKLELHSKGFYSIEAVVRYKDGSSVAQKTTAAIIGEPIPNEKRNMSPFGLWHASGDIKLAELAGARWTRQMWKLTDYQQDSNDKIIPYGIKQIPTDNSLKWIGTLARGLPQWLTDGVNLKKDTLYPPNDWSRLERLIERFVMDVKEFPLYFEVYNEPEAHWQGTDEELVKFESLIAKAVKAVNPKTKVLGPGLATIDLPRLKKLVDLGLLENMDGLVMHAYVNGTPPEAEFIQRVKELRAYLASIGREDFPVYLTEFGWTTAEGTWQKSVSELAQSQYLSRALTLLTAENIDAIVYFCMLYKNAPNAGEAEFSILRQDNTPKPAYVAYSNVVRWLTGVERKGRWLKVTPTTNLVVFRKGSGAVAVAWDTQVTTLFTISQPWITVQDMMGRTIPLKNGAEIVLGQSPVFIEYKETTLYDSILSNISSAEKKLTIKDEYGDF